MGHAGDRLLEAVEKSGTAACVGLDPMFEKLPDAVRDADAVGSIERFCMGVLDGVDGVVGVVKPQSACFERYGSAGVGALERVCARARELGLFVILDAKRGDIGTTAAHYAAFAFDAVGADAVTVNAYMGFDTVEPFLRAGRGVFVLVRTSNGGSDEVQSVGVDGGDTVGEMMARGVAGVGASRIGTKGFSDVGAVVAATKPADAARMRELMAEQVFLVPGFGAQGGTVETVRELFVDGKGAVVNSSRGVLYADGGGATWTDRVRGAAGRFADEVRRAAGG